MCCRQSLIAGLLISSVGFSVSCGRAPVPVVDRIAILPLENLTSDATLDWVSRAAQYALANQLTGVGNLFPRTVPDTREARLAGATRAVEGYLSGDANLLRIHAVVEDLSQKKAASEIEITGPRQKGLLPLIDQLAKAVNPLARPYSTKSDAALEEYAKGDFAGAVKQDAAFGPAYVNWIAQLRFKGDRDAGLDVLSKAKMQGDKLNELDRAQIDVAAAWLHPEDRNARRAAMMNLAMIVKYDTQLFRELSDAALLVRNYKSAAEWLEKSLAVEPGDTNALNSLAYAYALSGDLAAAERTIAQYRKVAPGDANTYDSMGEIYFVSGKFVDAEKAFSEGFEKSPQFSGGALMYKAAFSRLMLGDEKGASGLFDRYLEFRQSANDPTLEARRANWEFLTGRRKAALARLAKLETAQARGQLAILLLLNGDAAGARKQAESAMQPPAQDKQLASMAIFLAGPATTAAQWQEAAARVFGPASAAAIKNQFVAYGMFLKGQYADAAALLGPLVTDASPLSGTFQKELLAASLVGAGRVAEAEPLVAMYPIPDGANENVFTGMMFPRLFETRAAVLEKQGKAAEAKAMRELASKFAAH